MTKANCKYCHQPIVDGREIAGADREAWMTPEGDFGCDMSPETCAEYVGNHEPKTKPVVPNDYDAVGAIIAYEQGDLSEAECLILFQHLINTGLAWQLQGHYGRTATALIKGGHIFPKE